MNCKKIVQHAFSELAPTCDSKAICAAVTERAKNMNTKKKTSIGKGAAAALVAAAVLGTATVTVGAATGWDFNSAFGSIFNQNKAVDVSTDSVNSPAELFDFQRYGKLLDESYTFSNYSLNLKAISADKTTAYILFDVVFDENYDYQPKEGWNDWRLYVLVDALEEGETKAPIGRLYRNEINLIKQTDNTLSFYAMVGLKEVEDTFANKTLILDFGELSRIIPTASERDDRPWLDRQELECGVHTEIEIDFDLCDETRSFTIDKAIEFSEGGTSAPAVVKAAELTPFSWEFYVELDTLGFEKGDGYLADIIITMADGTTITPHDYMIEHDENGSTYRGIFHTPIKLDSVVSADMLPIS